MRFFEKFTHNFSRYAAGGSPETTTPGVSALQGIQQLQGFYPMQLPQLTPGLSQFVNDDLTEHVRGWPAEACERQVRRIGIKVLFVVDCTFRTNFISISGT